MELLRLEQETCINSHFFMLLIYCTTTKIKMTCLDHNLISMYLNDAIISSADLKITLLYCSYSANGYKDDKQYCEESIFICKIYTTGT